MNEMTAQAQFDQSVIAAAFDKLRVSDTAEREVGCVFVGERLGAEAEAELRRSLAAHDAEMARRWAAELAPTGFAADKAGPVAPNALRADKPIVLRRLPPTTLRERDALRAATEPKAEPEPDDEFAADEFEDFVAEPEPEPSRIQLPALVPPAAAPATSDDAYAATLNQKHAVIGNYGGKCAVLSWERWNVNADVMVPTFQSLGDFKNRYLNRYALRETDKGTERVSVGKHWLSDPKRLTYDGIVFEPGAGEVASGNRLNLWRGFAVKPKRGDWSRMRAHIYDVLGAGDPKAGEYIERWLAWTLQNPGKPAEAVLVLRGDEGAGKGTLAQAMLKFFGAYGLPVSDPKHLVGSFSGHLQHCAFLFLDEAFWAGDQKVEGRLKSLVTEETIMIEPKYFSPFQVRNVLHIMMASNSDWVVPAGHGARRYAVFEVSDDRIGDFAYFDALNNELDAGGREAMLHDLLELDLRGWHPKMIYETSALIAQKQHTLRGLDAWIETMLQEGALPNSLGPKYPNRSLSQDLLSAAKECDRYTNPSLVALKLQAVLGVTNFGVKYARGWAFPPLPECRQLWERRNGGRWHWHRDVTEWQFNPSR